MKDTDDGNQVDGSDAGAVPATSTKTWADEPVRWGPPTLCDRNVHGVKAGYQKPASYYYTPDEWSRSVSWGKVPDKRNIFYKKELDKLEKEIQYYPEHVKPMTKQWDRIQELRKIMGVN